MLGTHLDLRPKVAILVVRDMLNGQVRHSCTNTHQRSEKRPSKALAGRPFSLYSGMDQGLDHCAAMEKLVYGARGTKEIQQDLHAMDPEDRDVSQL
ncbi:hypothetical protein NDU88_003520 [Pleurodeles waltl]|uniref:Uncharacterized protein n=1 Tax=Pleurodeles waltl TaxID=8319 RepID=A0AAV7W5B2_PLEWA|nr:hypothetical protein NDU88_003520 [Pleurodeles waltl]